MPQACPNKHLKVALHEAACCLICLLWVGPKIPTVVADPDTVRCHDTWNGFRLELYEYDKFKTKK